MINIALVIIVGLAGGLSVGAGFVAFLTVLNIIPRLTQLTKTNNVIHFYEGAVIMGAIAGALGSFLDVSLHLSPYILLVIGLCCGIFNGMLAAALTEVLNVFPILARRIGMEDKILYILMALVLGKIAGSLVEWIWLTD